MFDPIEDPSLDRKPKKQLPFPEETEIKYFTGIPEEECDCRELERIMTRSFRCAGELEKPGDLCVIVEDGAFDKNGVYHVLVKYAELPERDDA